MGCLQFSLTFFNLKFPSARVGIQAWSHHHLLPKMQIVHWLQLIPHLPRRAGTLLIHHTPKTYFPLSQEVSPITISNYLFFHKNMLFTQNLAFLAWRALPWCVPQNFQGGFCHCQNTAWTDLAGGEGRSTLAPTSIQVWIFTTSFCTACVPTYSLAANTLLPAQMKTGQKIFYPNTPSISTRAPNTPFSNPGVPQAGGWVRVIKTSGFGSEAIQEHFWLNLSGSLHCPHCPELPQPSSSSTCAQGTQIPVWAPAAKLEHSYIWLPFG